MPAVGRIRGYPDGGILALISILAEHWGAVGRDLAHSHWTWDDVGDRLPFNQFVQFVVYSPPGTAVFHKLHEGFSTDTHRLADLVDIGMLLLWSKTEDGQDNRNRPHPVWRPGQTQQQSERPAMTVGEYMKLSGMED